MRFKLLLITMVMALCRFSVQAQQFIKPDEDLIYQLTYVIKGLGSTVEYATISTHDFAKVAENTSITLFQSHRDTAVYIGMQLDANKQIMAISVLLPTRYLPTVLTFCNELKFKGVSTTNTTGRIESENDENHMVFWISASPGKMMMVFKKKGTP